MRPIFLLLFCAPALALAETLPDAASALTTLSLDEALARLQAANPDLAQARAGVREARALAFSASASLQPTVTATGAYTRNADEAIMQLSAIGDALEDAFVDAPFPVEMDPDAFPEDRLLQPLESWTATGTVRVPIVAATGWADLSAARGATRAAQASTAAVEQKLEGALWKAAWLAEAAEGATEAAERAHAAAEAHLTRARTRAAAGTATRLDVLSAEADLAARAGDLAAARGLLDHARRAVAALLGESEPIRIEMPDPVAIATEIGPGGDPATALAARPDRDALDARIDAQRAQVTSADLRHLPTLTGTFAAFASDTAYVTGEKDGWRAGVELGWVLYDGGLRYGKRAQARAGLAAAEAGRAGLDAQIRREVAEADRALALAGDRVAAAVAGRAAAGEAADFAARAYDAGTLDAYATTAAADRLFAAEVALAQARAALGGAAVDVRLAAGASPGTR